VIVIDLHCRHEHRFEGWFASSEAFDGQMRSGMVCCPFCNSGEISRLPSGPHLNSSPRERAAEPSDVESLGVVVRQLRVALRAHVVGSENVGERFPDEARRIHYEDAPARSIRGVASIEQARDLIDEGIVVLPLLVPPNDETH
jgi:hypothetical protein